MQYNYSMMMSVLNLFRLIVMFSVFTRLFCFAAAVLTDTRQQEVSIHF